MNRLILLVTCGLLAACGVSPVEADKELRRSVETPDQWCSVKLHEDTEDKLGYHPEGYGITATYGCFSEDWPGGFCYAPGTKTFVVKVFTDGQDAAWIANANNEYGSWRDRLNSRGWNISKSNTGYNMEVRTSMVATPGVLGATDFFMLDFLEAPRGDYIRYEYATVTLFRARIEANVFYQSANATQKQKYLKNIWDHEYSHVSGLAHTEDTENLLMSEIYYFPGPRFDSLLAPTTTELQMLDDFEPLEF